MAKLSDAYSSMKKSGHSMSEAECEACGSGCCKYAGGGEVKGVHKSSLNYPIDKADEGMSEPGRQARIGHPGMAKGLHMEKIEEMKSMPKPKLKGLAEGGEVSDEPMESSGPDDMLDQCAGELLEAIHSKNKQEILESLKAIILSCGE